MQELQVGRRLVSSQREKTVRIARQRMLDKWDALPKSQRPRGVVIANRRNLDRPLVLTMEGSFLIFEFGDVVARTRVEPARNGNLQPKQENRTLVEVTLKKIMETHPEVIEVLEDYVS